MDKKYSKLLQPRATGVTGRREQADLLLRNALIISIRASDFAAGVSQSKRAVYECEGTVGLHTLSSRQLGENGSNGIRDRVPAVLCGSCCGATYTKPNQNREVNIRKLF